tara:strand:+ start:264 stop:716 length:453 start_codon:yes stop_codon:yes gene_type:complete
MSKSAIKDSIQSDQIKFLKEGNKKDSSTLRFALSFLNKEEKDKKIELNDSEVIKIIKSMIKRNKDSYDQFINAGRQELADKERDEIDLLNTYLPELISEVETEEIVRKVIEELDIKSIKDMGKAMGIIKNNHGDNIDMSLVSKCIKKLLS